ncbi:MAG TPA: undecaprenyl-diphosphate phosphatase, partial [Lachnospiraceae bacterium]|nr:undecaprenyl-diphosphate phosphatase [Lachnospiraceae bacterium]
EGFKIIGDFIGNLVRFMTNTFTKRKVTYKKILSTPYRRFVLLIIVSTIPTAIFGYGFQDAIEIAGRTLLVPG